MAKGTNQKLKLLRLRQILMENTDDEHGLTMEQIIEELGKYDISAERKSIASDMDALQLYGIDIVGQRKRGTYLYHVGEREFELAELKLLVDAVQSSKFITATKSKKLIKKLSGFLSKYDAKKLQRQVYERTFGSTGENVWGVRGDYLYTDENIKVAHVNNFGEMQSIKEHLLGTANLARQFAAEFDCDEIGYLCGLMHDIGKYSEEFQRRIEDPEHVKKVDHSTAGAKELRNQSNDYIPLAMAIAGHHSGLLDGGSAKVSEAHDGTFFGRLKNEIPAYEGWEQDIFPPKVILPEFCCGGANPGFTMSFFIRMIYSCLVDADYLDTEKFMFSNSIDRGTYSSISELLERFENYISPWIHRTEFDSAQQKLICQKRSKILLNCLDKGDRFDRGLYTLTVPTGGGKTTASLGFALNQMRKHGMKRVIYVIPYTSIIDQTAMVFSEILGKDNVLEHHSGVLYELNDSQSQSDCYKALATENWDKPVIVTTAVQFFESLYACKSSRCRKLHNIANSVIIFDEAQTLPVFYLKPCVAAVAELVAHYKSTVVLCTATQPALQQMFEDYLPNLGLLEICDDLEDMYQCFRRTQIRYIGTLNIDELCGHLIENKQVLCIVNRRKSAQEIYKCVEEEGTYCLTTLIYPAARKKKIEEIKGRLRKGLTCRVIATSLIEAGVDIDFPKVYREETGLDSVIQAAGRCNREGKRSIDNSIVSVFRLEGSYSPFLSQNIAAFQWMQKQFDDLGDLRAISDYFDFYRDLLGQENLDIKNIMQSFANGLNGKLFPFATVAKQFQLMEDETIAIYIPLGEGEILVNQLVSGEYDKNIFRQLGQYSINVFPNHLRALWDSGCLEQLNNEVYILRDLTQYNNDLGLQMDIETGNAFFV